MVEDSTTQRIARLTPLGAILALIESRVGAVRPRKCDLAQAQGATLAEDVLFEQLPPSAIALRDGFAVDAAAVAEASPYAPAPLGAKTQRVDVGEVMPDGTDAVLPLDAVNRHGGRAEAIATVTPGEGVLPAGGDATSQTSLRHTGERMRALDVAVMAAAGIAAVTIRAPRIRIVHGGAKRSPPIEAAVASLARAVAAAGGSVSSEQSELDAALTDEQADGVIAVGGTGGGQSDAAVQTLARFGRLEAYGIAVSPGETAAFGFSGVRPVLLIPGRLDAALALWLLIGRNLVAKLAGGKADDMAVTVPLKRKVTSTIGLTELMPVTCRDGMAEPLGSGYLSFQSLARSDGWIAVPADSEGFAAGTPVAVRLWP
jgi:molybdopterin molybdotransferase